MSLYYVSGLRIQKCDEQMTDIAELAYEYARIVVRHQAEEELILVERGWVGVRTQELGLLLRLWLIVAERPLLKRALVSVLDLT